MATNVTVTNQALAEIGTESQISSLADTSQEARYANLLYVPLRDFLLRTNDFQFSRVAAGVVSNSATVTPWSHAYDYPVDCVRVHGLVPASPNTFDPTPIEFGILGIPSTRIIVTNVVATTIIYTSNAAVEDDWDSMFMESMVRLLGSALSFALKNTIEASREKMQEAITFATMDGSKAG